MVKNAEIAVLMPAYNPGPDIVDTLDSLKQQGVPFKLFVIDDGSLHKPDYNSLLAGFDHHLILSPKNIGVNEARNPALKQILAEGFKYIALIDCGDIARPNRLLLQKQYLDGHPNVDILGTAIRQIYRVSGLDYVIQHPELPADTARVAWAKLPLSHPTVMFRRHVFERIGLYSGRFFAAEDYDLVRRALQHGLKVANLPDVLLDKIETTQSVSHLKRIRQLNSRLAIQWQFRNLLNPYCLAGIARTIVIRFMPKPLLDKLKKQSHLPYAAGPKI